MLRAVIFDLDGVIADSHPIHEITWKTLLTEQGLDPNRLSMNFILAGRPRNEILRHYLGDLPASTLESLGRRKDELYSMSAASLMPIPGLLKLLDRLDICGIAKAVATSAGRRRTLETLGRIGIADRFAAVVTGEDVRAQKPNPDIFELGLARLGVSPAEAMAIEDSVAGIQAARAAGMKCVGYAESGRRAELLRAGADEVILEFEPDCVDSFERMFQTNGARFGCSA
ncbi:MAG: HAD family phosphatase [Candidatus Acidiferrales bacterium]